MTSADQSPVSEKNTHKGKILLRITLGLVAALVAVAITLGVARKSVLAFVLESALARYAMVSEVSVDTLDRRRLALSLDGQTGLDSRLVLRDVMVNWRLGLGGVHIETARIGRVELPMRIDAQGVRLGAIDDVLASLPVGGGDGPAPAFLIETLVLHVITEAGPVKLKGAAGHHGGRYWLNLQADPTAFAADQAKLNLAWAHIKAYADEGQLHLNSRVRLPEAQLPQTGLGAQGFEFVGRVKGAVGFQDLMETAQDDAMQLLRLPVSWLGSVQADHVSYNGSQVRGLMAQGQYDSRNGTWAKTEEKSKETDPEILGGGHMNAVGEMRLSAEAQNKVIAAVPPSLAQPYGAALRRLTDAAHIDGALSLARLADERWQVRIDEPLRVRGKSGGRVEVTASSPARLELSKKRLISPLSVTLQGGGLPQLTATLGGLTADWAQQTYDLADYRLRYSGQFDTMVFDGLTVTGDRAALDLTSGVNLQVRQCQKVAANRVTLGDLPVTDVSGLVCPQRQGALFQLADTSWSANVSVRNGGLGLPTQEIRATGLDSAVRVTGRDDGAISMTVPISRVTVTDQMAAKRFGAMKLRGRAQYDGQAWTGKMTLYDGYGNLGPVEFTHKDTGAGQATLRLPDVNFAPEARTVAAVVPSLADAVQNTEGSVDGEITVTWTPETITAPARFSTTRLNAIVADGIAATGVSGDIEFVDLFTLTSKPQQTATVEALQVGVPLNDVKLIYQIETEALALQSATAPFAGGTLSLEPMRVPFDGSETRGEVNLKGVTAEAVIALLEAKDLSATGTFDGRLPFILGPEGARIDNGAFAALAPGVIRFDGPSTGGTADLAMQALKNFSYEVLTGDVSGDPGGEMTFKLTFVGKANETVNLENALPGGRTAAIAGAPFKFNLTTSLNLARLLEGAAAAGNATGEFQKRVEEGQAAKNQSEN